MGIRLAHVAFAGLLLATGAAGAATPLFFPAKSGTAALKSSDMPVAFNREALERLTPGSQVELQLPDGSRHDYLYEYSIHHGGGFTTWIARSPLTGVNERAIITYGPHGAWGSMATRFGQWRVYPSGDGHDLIAKVAPENHAPKISGGDAVLPPPDLAPLARSQGAPTWIAHKSLPTPFFKSEPLPQVRADIMVLYTRDLATKLGLAVMPMIYNTIAGMNQRLADSEVAIRYRLVYAVMIDYENGDHPSPFGSFTTLDGMGGQGVNAAFFESLTWGAGSRREQVGADFVTLLRDGPTDTGGVAYLLTTHPAVSPSETAAYSVLNGCLQGCAGLLAHEAGHNMGLNHDPATISRDFNAASLPGGTHPYSLGYYSCAGGLTCNPYVAGGCPAGYPTCVGTDANDFGEIMSYLTPKLSRYSDATRSDCVPPGGNAGAPRACGGPAPAPAPPGTVSNAVLSLNTTRTSISGYRSETLVQLPGSVQFTKQAFTGTEGNSLTFTVSRANGSFGAISANYTMTGGTATPIDDFAVTSGTLNWADGDTADKTIIAPIALDSTLEHIEAFTATLTSASGSTGVYRGYPATAVGLIVTPWPPYGTAPSGFSSATTPSEAWTVDSQTYDPDGGDTTSFASAVFPDVGGGFVPFIGNSSSVLTATFLAGPISFAYRVSSFPYLGFFEFLVDGVVVHTDMGDTGLWSHYFGTITAGTHTLEWRYRKTQGFSCRYASYGGAPPFPNCQDRVWIDTVSLPLAAPPPPPPANPARLFNISTRGRVGAGGDVMIAGFIVGGPAPKTLVINVAGPHLANFGITGFLANPTLTLVRSSDNAIIASNDNWQTQAVPADVSRIIASGFQPNNPAEPAIIATLPAGAYTAIVQGAGSTTGVGLVGVFEVDEPTVPLINISTRMQVGNGGDVMIAGFIIQGDAPQTVVVNVAGPHLANFGITGFLANPQLTLVRSSDNAIIASNDNWQTQTVPSDVAAIMATGFQPNHPNEPAIKATLPPGAYTAIVTGVGNSTGVGLVGVFRVP